MKKQNQLIADYYNQTQNHYEKWWQLKDNLSLHYGIWDNSTKDFNAALANTNKLMHAHIGAPEHVKVLDAGCGVGGAAIYLAKNFLCEVQALSLSEKQIRLGRQYVNAAQLEKQITFHQMDFTQTSFESASFDVVWACESVCHTTDKKDFIREAFRLLKPGGKLIMSDFFLADATQPDPHQWIEKWARTWGIPNFSDFNTFRAQLNQTGFKPIQIFNYTEHIKKSAKKMYYAALMGALPSVLYNLMHPKVSAFAKTHYKCGYYQYKALKAGLWEYNMLVAIKATSSG